MRRMVCGFCVVACCLALIGVSGCSDQSGLPYGTVYRAIDGKPAIKVVSSKELEWTRGGDRLVCEYSREGDRLRVVAAMLGTKHAMYLTIVPEGLREEDGTVFYRPDRYDQVMREVIAERNQRAVNERLLEAVGKSDVNAASMSIQQGAQVNAVNRGYRFGGLENYTAMHVATEGVLPRVSSGNLFGGFV